MPKDERGHDSNPKAHTFHGMTSPPPVNKTFGQHQGKAGLSTYDIGRAQKSWIEESVERTNAALKAQKAARGE